MKHTLIVLSLTVTLSLFAFETIDIAPNLKKGENHIAAKVWNMANLKPLAQISHQTGLIIQGLILA